MYWIDINEAIGRCKSWSRAFLSFLLSDDFKFLKNQDFQSVGFKALRNRLAPNGETLLLSVSRLVASKNIDKIIEAMLCGDCIIALDRGTTRDLIKDGENGVVISDPQFLAEAIIGLLKDPKSIAKFGAEAKKTMETWPSWEERVNKEVDVIKELTRM